MNRMWMILGLFGALFFGDVTTAINGSLSVFPVDLTLRAEDLVSMFNAIKDPPKSEQADLPQYAAVSQIAIQTTKNGLLANVLALRLTQNKTILMVRYAPNNVIPNLYAAIPIEQITMMVTSQTTIPVNGNFSSSPQEGVLPTFTVDMHDRAEDWKEVFDTFNSTNIYASSLPGVNFNLTSLERPASEVQFQTSLSGPFYAPIPGGVIPEIQDVFLKFSTNGTLLLIEYKPTVRDEFIIVSPDQIFGVIYKRG